MTATVKSTVVLVCPVCEFEGPVASLDSEIWYPGDEDFVHLILECARCKAHYVFVSIYEGAQGSKL